MLSKSDVCATIPCPRALADSEEKSASAEALIYFCTTVSTATIYRFLRCGWIVLRVTAFCGIAHDISIVIDKCAGRASLLLRCGWIVLCVTAFCGIAHDISNVIDKCAGRASLLLVPARLNRSANSGARRET
jgi:hypothetical protein